MCNNLKPIYWGKITGSVIENPSTLLWSDFWRHSCHSEDLGAIALKPRLVRDSSSHDRVGNALNYQQQWAWLALSRLPEERGKMTRNKTLLNTSQALPRWIQTLAKMSYREGTGRGGEHFTSRLLSFSSPRLLAAGSWLAVQLQLALDAPITPPSPPPNSQISLFFSLSFSPLSPPLPPDAYALKSWKKWFSLFILL